MFQLLRYIFVGGFCSIVYVAVANAAELFAPASVATFIGYTASGISGYFLQMKITFATQANHLKMGWKYIALTLFMLVYSEGVTYIGVELSVRYVFVTIFTAATMPLFSFPLQKFWVYR